MWTTIRCAVIATLLLGETSAAGDPPLAALNAILGEDIFRQNLAAYRISIRDLPDQQKFERLCAWVLPSAGRREFRLDGFFSAVDPAPVLTPNDPSAAIVSAAYDLVDLARETGRLSELQERVQSVQTLQQTDKKQQAAMLFLIAMAKEDIGAAGEAMERFAEAREAGDDLSHLVDWPVLLVLNRAAGISELELTFAELMGAYFHVLSSWNPDPRIDLFLDHLRWLDGKRLSCSLYEQSGADFTKAPEIPNWHSVEYFDATTRALGRPRSHWQKAAGAVRKLAGHEMDHLQYRMPLRGDYVIEWDLSDGNGRMGSPMVAGTRLEVIEAGHAVKISGAGKRSRTVPINPPLSALAGTGRYRAVVNDGQLKLFVNGRLVLTKPLPEEHDPWVSVESWRRAYTDVFDVQISGHPEVPNSVNLLPDHELSGWTPYYIDRVEAGQDHWKVLSGTDGFTLKADVRRDLAGSWTEELLSYHRPVIEDGVIQYEFFYEIGEAAVFPALDRCCFLFDAEMTGIHWLTDGAGELSDLSPDNRTSDNLTPVAGDSESESIPLRNGEWNRVRMELSGNTVLLSLNGQEVLRRQMEPGNRRTFGLFHYADQTRAEVRNIVWTGGWLKKVPPVADQELANLDPGPVDIRADALPKVFHHDFSEGAPSRLFDFSGDETSIVQESDGVRVHCGRDFGLQYMATCFRLKGDFDIEARFRDLKIRTENEEYAGIGLMTFFDNQTSDDLAVYRRTQDKQLHHRAMFAHKRRMPDGKVPFRGKHIPEECTSGRLRLARRGTTLYGFIAEDDSENDRLINTWSLDEPTEFSFRPRLPMQASGESSVEVVWQSLTVHAEGIRNQLPSPEDERRIVEDLNSERQSSIEQEVDLNDPQTLLQRRIVVSDTVSEEPRYDDDGLHVVSVSTGPGNAVYMYPLIAAPNVSDVEVDLKVCRIDASDRRSDFSEVALMVPTTSKQIIYAAVIIRRKSNDVLEVVAQTYEREPNGRAVYRAHRSLPVSDVRRLRLVVQDKSLVYLFAEDTDGPWRFLAESPLREPAVADRVMLRTEAYGSGRIVDSAWRRLRMFSSAAPR
ncbi:MAG: DUF1583 domain-containing protein [Planctomycetaceae bacterium]|nr:DUF1583 domain-containing protein [Planctomycetaceae bacterium]